MPCLEINELVISIKVAQMTPLSDAVPISKRAIFHVRSARGTPSPPQSDSQRPFFTKYLESFTLSKICITIIMLL